MTAPKCIYCGGQVVKNPEGELVCSVCGSVQPSGVVQGVRGALSMASDGISIEEFELPKEYIEAKKRAVKEWLKEQYVQAVVEVEEAHYGWLWFFTATRKGNKDLRRYLTELATMSHLSKLVVFVHKIISSCHIPHPITAEALVYLARRHGLRSRRRERMPAPIRYTQSDVEILIETLDTINAIKRIHCEKHCDGACGKSRDRSRRSSPAPPKDAAFPP